MPSSRIVVGFESRLPLSGVSAAARGLRQPLVRLGDAASEREVAERGPDDEEEDDQDERDRDPRLQRTARPPRGRLSGPGRGSRGARPVRSAPVAATSARSADARARVPSAPAAVDAVGLLSAGGCHPAAYGTRRSFGAVAGHRRRRRRDEDPRRLSSTRQGAIEARARAADAASTRRTRCSTELDAVVGSCATRRDRRGRLRDPVADRPARPAARSASVNIPLDGRRPPRPDARAARPAGRRSTTTRTRRRSPSGTRARAGERATS